MAVGHLTSTLLAGLVSLVSPDDFRFEDVAEEGSELVTDGGESGGEVVTSETVFTALLVVFWLVEFAFGSVVTYWFVTQGFASEGRSVSAGPRPLESREFTLRSLAMWAGFFAAIGLMIVVGA